jgi:signal transduction histidine kinase
LTLSVSADDAATLETLYPARRSSLASPRAILSLSSAFLVCALVIFGAQFRLPGTMVCVVWLASGVAVAGWLNGPRGRDFDLAYAALVSVALLIGGLIADISLDHILIFALASIVEIVTAVAVIRRFTPALQAPSLGGLLRYLIFAPVLAPLISSLVLAMGPAWPGARDPLDTLVGWWLSHALGLAAIGPLGLYFARGGLHRRPSALRLAEGVLILGALAATSAGIYWGDYRVMGFLAMPLVFLAAIRLRLPGASLALVIIMVVAMIGAVWFSGHDPLFLLREMTVRVRVLQLFLICTALPVLPIAALLDERDRLAIEACGGQAKAEAASIGKSRLLANVSHEIKSPVAGIIGIGELWSTGKLGPVTPMQQEMAEMLVRTARQVESLAYDLLDVSNAEAGSVSVKLRPVDVAGLLEDVRRTLAMRPEAEKVKVSIEGATEDLRALADSLRLTQVLSNLGNNALKYGGSGGEVVLRADRPRADLVRLSVIDRGPGIPLDRQSELFEPFNRLGMERSTIEGNGIGLTLAKRLIELQGGVIGFESRPGEGAKFWVELPAA